MGESSNDGKSIRICEAVAGRRLLAIWYDDGSMIVEPYCHGNNGAGKEILVGYQIRGHSKGIQQNGWKKFEVQGIERIDVLEKRFERNRVGFEKEMGNVRWVHCRV